MKSLKQGGDNMRFADKIMKLRDEQGVSQKDLAKAMGVSRQTVYKWEADLSVPEIDKIKSIAQYFGVSYNELLDDKTSLPSKKILQYEDDCKIEHQATNAKNKSKLIIIAIVLALIAILITIFVYFFIFKNNDSLPENSEPLDTECTHLTFKISKIIEEETCALSGRIEMECVSCGLKKERAVQSKKHVFENDECVRCHQLNVSKGIVYGIDEETNTAYVKSKGTCNDNRIIIAEEYMGYKVTKIGKEAFMYVNFESVRIPDSVTVIEEKAFFFCNELKEISFGNSLQIIGEYAFYHCGKIKEIIFPDSLEIIENNAFNLTKINTVLMGKSIRIIEEEAFSDSQIKFLRFRERGKWAIYDDGGILKKTIEIYPDENKNQESYTYASSLIWIKIE